VPRLRGYPELFDNQNGRRRVRNVQQSHQKMLAQSEIEANFFYRFCAGIGSLV